MLPWRETRDPYKIWLSEIILQQTRVAQGLPYYQAFLRQYPNVSALAAASEQEVLRLWQGLGYYSRARNLHACAQTIINVHGGKFPRTYADLKQLRGIGEYTAAAIASFAFGQRVAVVDGNVFRVLARVFALDDDIASPSGKRKFAALANTLIPEEDPALHNQAIMEFGALLCTPRNPGCDRCPLSAGCLGRRQGIQDDLPVKKRSAKGRQRHFAYIVVRRGNALLMKPRKGNDIWKGLWDFPLTESASPNSWRNVQRKLKTDLGVKTPVQISREYRHVLSHQVLHVRFLEVVLGAGKPWPTGQPFDGAIPCGARKVNQVPKPALVTRFLRERGLEG